MAGNILVVDVGESILGLQRVHHGRYVPYYGENRIRALERLEQADEVVTYNGNRYDIEKLNELSLRLRRKEFRMRGIHTDMQDLCWPRILGSSLSNTYAHYCGTKKAFPDTYEGSNRCDVYRTLMLWRYWKENGSFNWDAV